MTIVNILRHLFPQFVHWEEVKETMKKANEDAYMKGHDVGYKKAKTEILDPRRSMITFGMELAFPMDFQDYNSEEERETIATIVKMPEYQRFFKLNILCQAMKKFRDARTQIDPKMMAIFNIVGNQFVDLAHFYDNAPNPPKPDEQANAGSSFSSLLSDE